MTREMLETLAGDLAASGHFEARWEDDHLFLSEAPAYGGQRDQQERLAPDGRGLYAIGGFRRLGTQDWTWTEIAPPWPGDDTDARGIVALLGAPVPDTWPIANRIKARARIGALAGALELASDAAMRERICHLIGRRGTADCVEAVPALLPMLRAPEPGVRAEAADAITHIALATSANAVRAHAGGAGACVLAALESERDERARALLAAAAGALRHEPALPLLIALLGDGDWLVRREAAWSLGALRAPSSAWELANALARESDAHAAQAMRSSLSRIADYGSDRNALRAREHRA